MTEIEQKLQQALLSCLEETTIARVTVDQLCAVAGVTPGVFDRYYPDKFALLESLVAPRAATFDRVLAAQPESLSADALLLALYQALAPDAAALRLLLDVHSDSADLGHDYRESLTRRAAKLIPQVQLNVPPAFAEQLYATAAFTAIDWALRHGDPAAIATFMNNLARSVVGHN